jgi:hypothetical protein
MSLASRMASLASAALWLAPAAPALGASCAGLDGASAGGVGCVFEFRRGLEGWSGGFADLPAEEVGGELFDLRFARVRLPAYLGRPDWGLLLAGTNRSDDLLMFVKRRIAGLAPETRYAVRYHLRFATAAGAGCVGIGGAPGESVYVKAGASARAPVPVERDGTLRLPIDIGDQSQGGRDAKVLGDIAAPTLGCDGGRFALVTRDGNDQPVFPLTDRGGNLWLFVGFDSGYEGRTRVILDRIAVRIAPVRR